MEIISLSSPASRDLHNNTVEILRESVAVFQQELEKYKAKAEETADQFEGLVQLIKRSRAGDSSADDHISSILSMHERKSGMATGHSSYPKKLISSQQSPSKSRAIQNWLHLTTRLLAAECTRLESQVRQERYSHFEQRALYLDEMSAPSDSHLEDALKIIEKYSASDNSQLAKVRSRPQSGKLVKGRPMSHQRAASAKSVSAKSASESHEIATRDLFLQASAVSQIPSQEAKNVNTSELAELHDEAGSDIAREYPGRGDNGEEYTTYDDPSRYVRMDVYDCSDIVRKATRPVSSSTLKSADVKRSRPKSSQPVAEGRQLKYETTKMVPVKSAKQGSEKHATRGGKTANSAGQPPEVGRTSLAPG